MKAAVAVARPTRLTAFRSILQEKKLQAFVVPSGDAHNSEYVADCDKRRGYISQFDGSAGTAVVTPTQALLWTDGRYHNQASHQLSNDWTLMKQGLPDVPTVPEWLVKHCKDEDRIGLDPFAMSTNEFLRLERQLLSAGKKVELVAVEENPVDVVWGKDRPARPHLPLRLLPVELSGKSVEDKTKSIREQMAKEHVQALVVAALDEVAWLLNLRGSDIEYNPVFYAYVLLQHEKCTVYLDHKLSPDVQQHLHKSGVTVKPYGQVIQDVKELKLEDSKTDKVWMDGQSCNVALYQSFPKDFIVSKSNPIGLAKALKNDVELKGFRDCHVRDAAALAVYFSWLEDQLSPSTEETKADDSAPRTALNEWSVAEKLASCRAQQEHFVGLSFETISSSGPNGAVIHYAPSATSSRSVTADELYLCDSGGQYLDGTTDLTRTMHFGTPSEHQKACFTRVLQGHIALARAVFPHGTTGGMLDVLARVPLWQLGLDYLHGTGHGVGHFLNVHEGPHGISSSKRLSDKAGTPLQPGMTVTNEPGYYEDGAFGIRIENVMLVKEVDTPHKFAGKKYYGFDTISLVPIQQKMVEWSVLTPAEVEWINSYHADVLSKVGPLLDKQGEARAKQWLERECKPYAK